MRLHFIPAAEMHACYEYEADEDDVGFVGHNQAGIFDDDDGVPGNLVALAMSDDIAQRLVERWNLAEEA